MDMEETYQEVVYILREDGTVEEKFTLPDRVEDVIEENYIHQHGEKVVAVTEIIAQPNNVSVKSSSNFSTVTLVNSRDEVTSHPAQHPITITDNGNEDTQIFHLNGLDQLNLFNNSHQLPHQLMELDESVIHSDNVNVYELDEGSDNFQLLSSPESPNKFIINTINLNESNNVFTASNNIRSRPQQPTYSIGLPRTYPKTYSSPKVPRVVPVQGVSQLLLAHEVSTSADHSASIVITNARSVTDEEFEWIRNSGDKDEFFEEVNPEIVTCGTVEVETTKLQQTINYVYQDPQTAELVSFVLHTDSPEEDEEIKLELPDLPLEIDQVGGVQAALQDEVLSPADKDSDQNAIDKSNEEDLEKTEEVENEVTKLKKKRKAWFWGALDEGDELLRNYKRRPHKSKNWMCAVCYSWFNDRSELDKHFRESHFKTSKFQKCRFCNKKFLARFLCLRHERAHNGDLKLSLKRYFLRKGQGLSYLRGIKKPVPLSEPFTGHLLRLLKDAKHEFYECTDCDSKFSAEEYAREHYDLNHAAQECIFCNDVFENLLKLEEHQNEAHDFYYLKSFPNDYWSLQDLLNFQKEGKRDDTIVSRIEFLHPYALKPDLEPPERRNYFNYLKRMRSYEAEEAKNARSNSKFKFLRKKAQMPTLNGKEASEVGLGQKESTYECQICHATFPSDPEFSQHIKDKHSYEVKPKPFPCTYCDKKFATHSNRKEHERIHTQEKNYVCPFCNKGFIQISNLKKHITTHKDQNLKCNTCDKQFVTKNSLILHQRAHAADRKFKCNLCDRAYNYASLLKRHMRIHTGECPYECDICFQPFHELVSLHYHRKKIHTGERPHKCLICGKAFILSSDLKKHSAVHNKTDSTTPSAPSSTAKPGRLKRSKRYIEQNPVEMKPITETPTEEGEQARDCADAAETSVTVEAN